MTTKFYNLGAATCAASASDRVHAAMKHYLAVFEVPRLAKTDIDIRLQVNRDEVDDACQPLAREAPTSVRRSHPAQRYRVWQTEGSETLIPEFAADHVVTTTGRRILTRATTASIAATVGVRLVRQLIMRGAETLAGQALHAGAVIINGQGTLIGGLPGAGKTTVLTRLAEFHGGRLVSNDRTAVIPTSGACTAAGVPLAWRFTPLGAGGSPRLARALTERQLCRGTELVDGKVEVTPLEMAQILDSTQAPNCRINRVVILVHGVSACPRSGTRFLLEHLSFGEDDFFADDWLNLRPRLVSGLAPTPAPCLWERLTELPATVLSWSDPTELAVLAAQIAEASR